MRLHSRLRFILGVPCGADPGQDETEGNHAGDSERFVQSHHRPLRQDKTLEPPLSACAPTISMWSPPDRQGSLSKCNRVCGLRLGLELMDGAICAAQPPAQFTSDRR